MQRLQATDSCKFINKRQKGTTMDDYEIELLNMTYEEMNDIANGDD